MRTLVLLLTITIFAGAEEWKRVTSSPLERADESPLTIYVGPQSGNVYIASAAGIWRARASEVEADPQNAHWTNISEGAPQTAARQLMETAKGIVVGIFGRGKQGMSCDDCSVLWFDGTKWRKSSTDLGNETPLNLQADKQGYLYFNIFRGCTVWRSKDDGKHFSQLTSRHLYEIGGQQDVGCYALTIYNDQAYWGGEGGIMKSPLNFSKATLLCCDLASGWGRNVLEIVGDGDATHDATELISHSKRLNAKGYNIVRWAAATGWQPVPFSAGYPAYAEFYRYHQGLVKGLQPHQYFLAMRADKIGGAVYVTEDAGESWKKFDDTGLPVSTELDSYAEHIAIDPKNDSLFLAWNGKLGQRALFVYERSAGIQSDLHDPDVSGHSPDYPQFLLR